VPQEQLDAALADKTVKPTTKGIIQANGQALAYVYSRATETDAPRC
jgi:hypothetical protein